MIKNQENRCRLLHVPQRDVLDWFANAAERWLDCKVLSLPMIEGLPEDCRVESVHYDHNRHAFTFCIWSETFSEVPCGMEIPGLRMRYESIEVRTDADRLRAFWNVGVDMASGPDKTVVEFVEVGLHSKKAAHDAMVARSLRHDPVEDDDEDDVDTPLVVDRI